MACAPKVKYDKWIMICPNCGNRIAQTDHKKEYFDIEDTSWHCTYCGALWLSSDGWSEMGNLVIPTRCS